MKAVICTNYGKPEVLKIRETNVPVIGKKDMLLKMKATVVTFGDTRIRGFNVPPSYRFMARIALGFNKPRKSILGSIVAAEVAETGSEVTNFNVSDRVFGTTYHEYGTYAEYLKMPDQGVILTIPDQFSYEEAAALPWGHFSSLHFLRKAEIEAGHQILIIGASGSLGTAAVQLAKHFGAQVSGVCSTPNVELVRSLGADNVIDYKKEDYTITDQRYDIIYDVAGFSNIEACANILNDDGVMMHAVSTPDVNRIMKKTARRTGKRMIGGSLKPSLEMLSEIRDLAEKNIIKPVIDRTYPLKEIAEAHRYVDTYRKRGEVVIKISN